MSSQEIPSKHVAAVVKNPGENCKMVVEEIDTPKPGPGQVLVKVTHSGVCHTDAHLMRGDWSAAGADMLCQVGGHEGVGSIVSLGPDVKNCAVGDKVGMAWIRQTCAVCTMCMGNGTETRCPNQSNHGRDADGSFQQYAIVPTNYLIKVPEGIDDVDVGPVLCGGVTVYKALKVSEAKPGQTVAIIGAGGGLGHLGVQYARAMGLRVIGIDGGEDKEKLAKKLGAEAFVDFTKTKDVVAAVKDITGGKMCHAVVVVAASASGYATAPLLCGKNGTMVAVGLPGGHVEIKITPMTLFANGTRIVGSNVGTRGDMEEALDFAARGLVKPTVAVHKLSELEETLDALIKGEISGRAVIDLWA
ncbi:Histone acetyltransferase [Saitoella coloradoensis]